VAEIGIFKVLLFRSRLPFVKKRRDKIWLLLDETVSLPVSFPVQIIYRIVSYLVLVKYSCCVIYYFKPLIAVYYSDFYSV